MKHINLIGDIFGSTGYVAHTKQLFQALVELGVDVRLECGRPIGWERLVNDAELLALQKPMSKEFVSVCVTTPPYWRIFLADNPKEFYGFCVWEGDKVPDYWVEYLTDDRVTGVLVPSQHVKDAILNTINPTHTFTKREILGKKISVVPHGVDLSVFTNQKKKNKKFTFLANKGWSNGVNDRGGIQYVMQAFSEEFKKDEAVELRIKINTAYNPPGWDLKSEMEKLNLPKDRPNILVNTNNLPFKKLPEFYAQGDCFVCATRGEAFNLPGLEAKACGLPTIQTDFGGQVDYMTRSDRHIKYDLEDVTWDVAYEGIKWATPKIDHLRRIMRRYYKAKLIMSDKNIGVEAKDWSWRNSAKKLLEVIK